MTLTALLNSNFINIVVLETPRMWLNDADKIKVDDLKMSVHSLTKANIFFENVLFAFSLEFFSWS